jgi:transcriptional regulator with XRE-family HTH domain
MREIRYYWWEVYGHFSPGEGTLPHIGDVIRHYRKLRGLTTEELAALLQWSTRYIKMLESPSNQKMPELLPRRVLLAKALKIPPILLGLSSITLIDDTTIHGINAQTQVDEIVDTRAMAFYEGMLALSWDFYYTSSVQRSAKQLEACFELLNHDAQSATTDTQKDQYDSMRCRFYQLFSLVARDQTEIDQALQHASDAVTLALRLENVELIASAYLRRARVYMRRQEYLLAYQDAQNALPYADLSRDPLKGKVYQMAGESQAFVANGTPELQEKSLGYFNVAGKIARKGDLQPDGSFVKVDLTSVYIERAEALTLFGRYEDAHNALAIARKNLSPELTRWEINLLLEEAKTYFAEGDFDTCCIMLLDALKVVRAVNLQAKEARIVGMYGLCKENAPSSLAVVKLGKALVKSA